MTYENENRVQMVHPTFNFSKDTWRFDYEIS